ncbi:MAG: hypothetical protein B7C24_10635 [Bacteroidetes bacterium 4572_77]|nr:MAG: hypothetical protein B7C24_10635 [Bacteroidetes bacterium 4572_77]
MQIKHIKYICKRKAKGKLKILYRHIESNFGKLAEPFVLHSIKLNYISAVWAVLYETLLVEQKIKRSIKESIATCISEVNKCPYCIDAHTVMVFGTDKSLENNIQHLKTNPTESPTKEDEIIYWALHNLDFQNKLLKSPPFNKQEAPEIIGTAVLFHYINRMVQVFAQDSPFPISFWKKQIKYFAANFIFNKALKKPKTKGESLGFLNTTSLNNDFIWAKETPEIQSAFCHLKKEISQDINTLLSSESIDYIKNTAKNLDLLNNSFGHKNKNAFLENIKQKDKIVSEYCFLMMFEHHKIQDTHIKALKEFLSQEQILQLSAWSSLLIAENIGEALCVKS